MKKIILVLAIALGANQLLAQTPEAAPQKSTQTKVSGAEPRRNANQTVEPAPAKSAPAVSVPAGQGTVQPAPPKEGNAAPRQNSKEATRPDGNTPAPATSPKSSNTAPKATPATPKATGAPAPAPGNSTKPASSPK